MTKKDQRYADPLSYMAAPHFASTNFWGRTLLKHTYPRIFIFIHFYKFIIFMWIQNSKIVHDSAIIILCRNIYKMSTLKHLKK